MNIEQLIHLNPNIWPVAVLAMLRVLGMVMMVPLLGDQQIPGRIKILFSLVLVFCLWPLIQQNFSMGLLNVAWSPISFAIVFIKEIFFAFSFGFIAKLTIHGVSMMAQIVGTGMGFQVAQILNPLMDGSDSAFGSWKLWFISTVCFVANLHHQIITMIAKTFVMVPLGPSPTSSLSQLVVHGVTFVFETAIRFAAPLIVIQFFVNLSLGLINKAVPQLNAMIMGFPIIFLLCMIVLFFSYSNFVSILVTTTLNNEMNYLNALTRFFK